MANQKQFLMVADNLALDLVNTVRIENGEPTDGLETDADVLSWLGQAGFLTETVRPLKPGNLLATARVLRKTVLDAVNDRKKAKPINIRALNTFLACSRKHFVLVQRRDQPLSMESRFIAYDEMELFGPIAEAAAELLVNEDFDLVRQCEHENCILWFLDKTKAHRRRWCSMAICGNRQKVEAFRRRVLAEKTPEPQTTVVSRPKL
jgi:predicted RNA-binding Zn ribbon-like protein